MRKISDGISNTVFMSESIRSMGADYHRPGRQSRAFPYQYTLNGSTGLTPPTGTDPPRASSAAPPAPWTGPVRAG